MSLTQCALWGHQMKINVCMQASSSCALVLATGCHVWSVQAGMHEVWASQLAEA